MGVAPSCCGVVFATGTDAIHRIDEERTLCGSTIGATVAQRVE